MAMLYNLLAPTSRRFVFTKQQQNIEKLEFYSKSALKDQPADAKAQAEIKVQESAEAKPEEIQVKCINICN